MNLYLYGRASPVVMVDPNGMKDEPAQPGWLTEMQPGPTVAKQKLREDDDAKAAASAARQSSAARELGKAKRLRAPQEPSPKAGHMGLREFEAQQAQIAEAEASRKAAAEWAPSTPKGQDPVLGAFGGLLIASELGALKGVQLASRVLGLVALAGASGHEDSQQISAAVTGLLGGLGPSAAPEAAVAKGEVGAATALERRMAQAEQRMSASTPHSKSPAPLSGGRHTEAAELAEIGAAKETKVLRPSQADMDSATFNEIVGKPKFTPGGKPVGTIFDSTRPNLLEIKGGRSELRTSYQLRLQVFYSVKLGLPFQLRTSRLILPETRAFMNRWGVTIERM